MPYGRAAVFGEAEDWNPWLLDGRIRKVSQSAVLSSVPGLVTGNGTSSLLQPSIDGHTMEAGAQCPREV